MASFNPPLNPSDQNPVHPPPWVPRLHPGFFYTNDRKYYLYAQKKTRTLRDATKYIFQLAAVPEPGTIEVLVEGVPFSSYEIVGTELHLMATDQESFANFHQLIQYDETQYGFLLHGFAFGPSNQVSIQYKTLLWKSGDSSAEPTGNVFVEKEVTETFRIKEASRIDYQLTKPREIVLPTGETLAGETSEPNTLPVFTGFVPDPPATDAPVIITDDQYKLTDERGFQTEFALDPIDAELTFNTNRNFVQNPAFEVTATGSGFPNEDYEYPLEWWVTDDLTVIPGTGDPLYGEKHRMLTGTGQLIQTIDTFDPRTPWTFSLYTAGEATGQLCVSFLDEDGFYFDSAGYVSSTGYPDLDFCAHSTGLYVSSNTDWIRHYMVFGTEDETQCDATGIFAEIPDGATSAEIKIKRDLGELWVDAVAAEQDYSPSDFEPLDPNITIEYEGSDRGYWKPDPSGEFPLEINNLETNPLRSAVPAGFIAAEEFSDIEDFELGVGEIIEGSSPQHTGLLQITGSLGVVPGRKHLPYGKISGFYKFVPRRKFHNVNPAPQYDISDLTIEDGTPDPTGVSIDWETTDGLRIVNGATELVVLPDERIETRLDFTLLDGFSNPAYSFRGTITAASGEIYPEDPITNSLGQMTFTYNPPTLTDTGDLGQIDTITIVIGSVTETVPVRGYRPTGLDIDNFLT